MKALKWQLMQIILASDGIILNFFLGGRAQGARNITGGVAPYAHWNRPCYCVVLDLLSEQIKLIDWLIDWLIDRLKWGIVGVRWLQCEGVRAESHVESVLSTGRAQTAHDGQPDRSRVERRRPHPRSNRRHQRNALRVRFLPFLFFIFLHIYLQLRFVICILYNKWNESMFLPFLSLLIY